MSMAKNGLVEGRPLRLSIGVRLRASGDRVRKAACATWAWMRAHGKRPQIQAAPFALLSASLVILLNNSKLFTLVTERVDLLTFSGLGCVLTIFLALTGMLSFAFLLFGHPYVMKPLVMGTLTLSAVLSYFTEEVGAVFDQGMIRNVAEAIQENNKLEAAELLSVSLAMHVLLFGILPSALLLIPRIRYETVRRELFTRLLYACSLALLSALVALPNFRYLTYFSRENFELRYYATPTFALNCLRKYVTSSCRSARAPFEEIGIDAKQLKSGRARTVGILVVGETARADHFSLNGYERNTNPRLGLRSLLNFPNARAGGTSTAISVPYMFSFLGKSQFSTARAARQSNLLDVLTRAGVKVVWIDNNSGNKGVCDRIGYKDLRGGADPASVLFSDGGYFDEALLGEAEQQIESTEGDLLIVLHTMGSHGPAYYRRYPPAFEVFKPCCKASSPQRSPQAEVVNAYDNSILYTDHVLDRLIGMLERRPDGEAAFLFYASDHGESLGENGVYLHGLPEILAPAAQTRIPMLAWLSPRIVADRSLDYPQLQARTAEPSSHDNIPHTMLGLFQVRTSLYRPELDLTR